MSFNSQESRRSRIYFDKPTLTEQSHRESSDIHTIMQKYERTGIIDHVSAHKGTYMDYPDAPNFHAAMNTIAEANSMFESVPAQIRKKFHNDPVEYVEFMQDNANYDAIVKLGLDASHLTKPVVESPLGDATAGSPPVGETTT